MKVNTIDTINMINMEANKPISALPSAPLAPLPPEWHSLGHAFIHQAKTQPDAPAITDSTGINLTYHQLCVGAIALANLLHDQIGTAACVGILLPPSAAGALVNIALTLLGRIPVNLNYTATKRVLDFCVAECKIDYIVTSDQLIERLGTTSSASMLAVEALQQKASLLVKAWAWSEADLMPEQLLGMVLPGLSSGQCVNLDELRNVRLHPQTDQHCRLDDPATIIFTAGSTSEPKAVVLSHRNILSDILAIKQVVPNDQLEIVLGVLPFFHSFGFTVTLWTVLALGLKAVYHYDPFDARTVGKLCDKNEVTATFCTPTIMRSYLKRCKREQFETLSYCVLGGEMLKPQLAAEIKKTLGIFPLSGYGLAETSPVVASNLPGDITLPDGRVVPGNRPGTVGRPLPGTSIKIVHLDTDKELPVGKEGMILVQGPQVMMGYLNNEKANANAFKDNWFVTGDLGFLDGDGFLTITGRLSQFSKVGGEMVPHLAVEAELVRATGVGEQCVSVTSVPDNQRGERLAVVYTDLGMKVADVVRKLSDSGLSRVWIPDARDFVAVSSLPVLPNGKLDLRKIKETAAVRLAAPEKLPVPLS